MKMTKKIMSLAIVFAMVMAMSVTAFAQTVGTADANDKASITISNASKGETYTIYKLFDASVTGTKDGAIAYTGEIPESLSAYFTADTAGNITATDAAKNGDEMSDGLKAALKAWTMNATKTADAVSDGSALVFQGLEYGYYVVTTTQGDQAITVDSTNPNATIVDKNKTEIGENVLTKTVDDDDVYIGQTVTYTVTFPTTNYYGAGTAAKQIVKYTIEDTLPEFLSDVVVTSIIVDNDAKLDTTDDQTPVTAQFVNKKIDIAWVDGTTSKYDNGALVVIKYTAKVTDTAAIAGDGNTNKVTLTWQDVDNTITEKREAEETIYTYAMTIKKVSDKGANLAGATFQFPFYVKEAADEDGAYIYAGTAAGDGLVNTLTTPEDGEIIIKGVASGEYSITETVAPAGYNKLTSAVTVNVAETTAKETSATTYLDAAGNEVQVEAQDGSIVTVTNEKMATTVEVIVNKTGTELPSTGGIGTTIFYALGGLMAVGAGVLLVAKKRMEA